MKTHHRFQLQSVAAFLAASTLTLLAPAQTTTTTRTVTETRQPVSMDAPPAKLDHTDKSFIEDSAKRAMDAVRISQVASERSSNPQIKRLADMIVVESTALNEDLSRLAMSRGVTVPAKDLKDDTWVKKDAAKFDHDYLDKMVTDYEQAVKNFDDEARKGEDNDAVVLARKHLATLQKHLFAELDLKKIYK